MPNDKALLSELIAAAEEIESDIDYDFQSGEMKYHKDLLLTWKSGVFGKTGRCMADAHEIVEYANNEKVELIIAGFDYNFEDVYIVPTGSELLVKKSVKPGMFIVKFRSKQYELPANHLTGVFQKFTDSDIFDYRRIGERAESSEDEDPRRRSTFHSRSFDKNNDRWGEQLSEDDYTFDESRIIGALIYKNLHHE